MKLKTIVIDGVTYAVVDASGLPVYEHTDGKEAGFDAAAANARIQALNVENADRRTKLTAADERLKSFEGIEDPDAARKAIETVAALGQGELIAAGKVEDIKKGVETALVAKYDGLLKQKDAKIAELDGAVAAGSAALNKELVGGNFARSKWIEDNLLLPPDIAETYFGANFKVESGNLVGYDRDGLPIFSRDGSGKPATFDEAIEVLVGAYPRKDHILKGGVKDGGGAGGGGGGGDKEPNPWKADQLNRYEQAQILRADPAKAKRLQAAASAK